MTKPVLTARAFLVRGLLVGLLAGIAAFLVAHQVGESHVERAIELEEAGAAEAPADEAEPHSHDDGATHSHGDEGGGTEVSRDNQRTFGLATGTLAVGVALGGILALVAAAVVGRLGRLSPAQSTAVVALVGFVAVALVPFLKYPATPPAVGNAETIGERTGYYFAFQLVSVIVGVLAVALAVRLWERLGAFEAVVIAAGAYVVVVATVGAVLPTVNEVGDFPADTLWFFRRASLLTLATMWAVLGVGLTGLVGRLHQRDRAAVGRRQLAASL
ncbi:CbtA family protein [uncultured Nocardioides sp.]|uniref:CbtA family protein n=1 Tax=uncultured Nocardioides sp. TaxID=198441 RepID=UPI00260AE18F|nr:CbtA family protein [uncultured Nocardioides sp.]